jgi:predicted transcriptional regulator
LSALSDPTRRAILERLTRGPTRVTDVAAPFKMSLNAVSKHIKLLEAATWRRSSRCSCRIAGAQRQLQNPMGRNA